MMPEHFVCVTDKKVDVRVGWTDDGLKEEIGYLDLDLDWLSKQIPK